MKILLKICLLLLICVVMLPTSLVLLKNPYLFKYLIHRKEIASVFKQLDADGYTDINLLSPSSIFVNQSTIKLKNGDTVTFKNLELSFIISQQLLDQVLNIPTFTADEIVYTPKDTPSLKINKIELRELILNIPELKKSISKQEINEAIQWKKFNIEKIKRDQIEISKLILSFSKNQDTGFKLGAQIKEFILDKINQFKALDLSINTINLKNFSSTLKVDSIKLSLQNDFEYLESKQVLGILKINTLDLTHFLNAYTPKKFELTHTGDFNLKLNYDYNLDNGLDASLFDFETTLKKINIKGFNLDKVLEQYISSEKFNYLDVVGFVTMGPIGLLASKSTKLGGAVPGALSGTTHFSKIKINGSLTEKKLNVTPSDILTVNHHIKLKGILKLDRSKAIDFVFAPIDKSGCTLLVQQIDGTYDNPKIEPVKAVVGNILAPLKNVLTMSKNTLTGDCPKFK